MNLKIKDILLAHLELMQDTCDPSKEGRRMCAGVGIPRYMFHLLHRELERAKPEGEPVVEKVPGSLSFPTSYGEVTVSPTDERQCYYVVVDSMMSATFENMKAPDAKPRPKLEVVKS